MQCSFKLFYSKKSLAPVTFPSLNNQFFRSANHAFRFQTSLSVSVSLYETGSQSRVLDILFYFRFFLSCTWEVFVFSKCYTYRDAI